MKSVLLNGKKAAGRVTLVDDADYDLVTQYKWHVDERSRGNRRIDGPYVSSTVCANGKRSRLLMHGLITGWPLVDHIDHNGLNNRRSNLRPATAGQNNANSRSRLGSSSTYKGVWLDRGKWRAEIKSQGKKHRLGRFLVEEDAALAYNSAAVELFGEYALLNDIKPAA